MVRLVTNDVPLNYNTPNFGFTEYPGPSSVFFHDNRFTNWVQLFYGKINFSASYPDDIEASFPTYSIKLEGDWHPVGDQLVGVLQAIILRANSGSSIVLDSFSVSAESLVIDDDNAIFFAGNDQISLSKFNDVWRGWSGDDQIAGDGGDDIIYGDDGNDQLFGDLGSWSFTFNGASFLTYEIDKDSTGFGTNFGKSGNDSLYGGLGNDSLIGGKGNDLLDGGAGVDTAFFSGLRNQYFFSESSLSRSISDNLLNRDGTDTLINIEQIKFADMTLVFDLTTSQDTLVYRLYQAAFARTPDNGGFRYWADVADRTGMSAISLADEFLAAPEFTQKYGNPNNLGYATKMYGNVLGRTPDPSGLAYWAGQLDKGMPRDQLLVAFAVCDENVQLTGVHMSNGYWTV